METPQEQPTEQQEAQVPQNETEAAPTDASTPTGEATTTTQTTTTTESGNANPQ